MAKPIADYLQSRDNHFQLIRFAAALGVFVSHCFPLAGAGIRPLPVVMGYMAVNVFFVISGFLVMKSLVQRAHIGHFLAARVLRIYPALILAVGYSAFVVGALVTTLPLAEYLSAEETWHFVVNNSLLIVGDIPDTLPGVFSEAAREIVNAPLWTLPYEVELYLALALLGSFLLLAKNPWAKSAFVTIVIVMTVFSLAMFVRLFTLRGEDTWLGIDDSYYRFVAMFGAGILLYWFRHQVVLSSRAAIVICVLILLCAPFRPALVALTYSALPYLVLWAAYLPWRSLLNFNRLGDYSYGIYIFGFPTQQLVAYYWEGVSPAGLLMSAFPLTLLLAVCSWHGVETWALRLKPHARR